MANNPVELVLRHLKNVITGLIVSWSAGCLAHEDGMNSLSIGEGRDGRGSMSPVGSGPVPPNQPKVESKG
jgi:hypothetical protein